MNRKEKQRLGWVELYERTQDAGLTWRRCGISRPTLRKWWRRYQDQGVIGLQGESRCPISSPLKKVDERTEALTLSLRKKRKPGPKRIKSELKLLHDISLSVAVTRKILTRNKCKPLIKPPGKKVDYIRCCRPIPREQVQIDTCKIGPNLYKYTAIDDFTRYRVPQIYQSVLLIILSISWKR